MNLKAHLTAALTAATLAFPADARSAEGFVRSTVEYVRTLDGTINPNWRSPMFAFTLDGVSSAGSCPLNWAGRLVFIGESKEAYMNVLTAHVMGKEVAVQYNDAYQVNGHCRANLITLGNPPPLF